MADILKAALINICKLTTYGITFVTVKQKQFAHSEETSRQLSPNSAVPSQLFFFSIFKLIVLMSPTLFCFSPTVFKCHYQAQLVVFSENALLHLLYTTCPACNSRQSQKLAGEHSVAFSSKGAGVSLWMVDDGDQNKDLVVRRLQINANVTPGCVNSKYLLN